MCRIFTSLFRVLMKGSEGPQKRRTWKDPVTQNNFFPIRLSMKWANPMKFYVSNAKVVAVDATHRIRSFMTKCEKNNQQHLDSKEEEDFAMNRSSFVNEDVTTSNFQRQGHEIFRLFGGREISCTYQLLQWRGDFFFYFLYVWIFSCCTVYLFCYLPTTLYC